MMRWTKNRRRRISVSLSLALALSGIVAGYPQAGEAEVDSLPVSSPRVSETAPTQWDCVWFGHYWQNDTNKDGKANRKDEKEPIRWRVLSVDEEEVFLLAEKNLDVMPYDISEYWKITWKDSTMRSWLNGYCSDANLAEKDYSADSFLGQAFTEEEQSVIADSLVVNKDNPVYQTMGGKNTSDKVFLLSADEALNSAYGFSELLKGKSEARISKHTEFVWDGGTIETSSMRIYQIANSGTNSYWWLRTPGNSGITWVDRYGGIDYSGQGRNSDYIAVRPALRVKREAFAEGLCRYGGFFESDEDQYDIHAASQENKHLLNPRINIKKKLVTWDCVWFGNYWQGDTSGDGIANQDDKKQPILWRILEIEGTDAFLVSDRNLSQIAYNDAGENSNSEATWETCTLRSWLNGYDAAANGCGIDYRENNFLTNVFSEKERKAILKSELVNKSIDNRGNGGNNTTDQIFCLSYDDVAYTYEYGFCLGDSLRQAKNTDYARNKYGDIWWEDWWLRTAGWKNGWAAVVSEYGTLNSGGTPIEWNTVAVRPALHVDISKLDSDSLSYAGTVTRYDGGKLELLDAPPTPKPIETPTVPPTPEPIETTSVPPTPEPIETPSVPPTPEPIKTPSPPPIPEPIETPSVSPTPMPIETPSVPPTPEPPIDNPLIIKPPEIPVEPSTAEPSKVPTEFPLAKPLETPTGFPLAKPSESPAGISTAKPLLPSTGAPSSKPPGSAQMTNGDAFNGRTANLQVTILSVKLSRDNAPVIRWKMNGAADGYQLYRSRKKNTGYRMVKEFSSKKILRYTDKKTGAKKRYYYRIRCRKVTARGIVLGGFSKARWVKTLNLIRPKIKGSKGMTASQIPYITLRLKRYRGSKLSIYYRIGKGKYKRLKLTSSSIKKNHGRFKIQCSKVRRTYYFRVKTSIRRKGRRYYSRYSNAVRVRR